MYIIKFPKQFKYKKKEKNYNNNFMIQVLEVGIKFFLPVKKYLKIIKCKKQRLNLTKY